MRNKIVTRVLSTVLTTALALSSVVPVNAQTLSEVGLAEDTRGYAGNGTQSKSRTEDQITVAVTIGAGGTDASWTGLAELTPYIANDDVEMLNRHVTFGDEDSDGDIDSTDLFRSLESLKRGDIAFNATTSDMGDFYSDMFGIGAGGSFTYWINGNYCQYGTPDLYDHDNVIIVAFTGDYNAWGETDDSAYDGHKGETTYTSLSSITSLDSWSKINCHHCDKDPVPPVETDYYNTYIKKIEESVHGSYQSSGTGLWQSLRILRFAEASDKSQFSVYQNYYAENHGVTLGTKAVDDMRVLSVVNDQTAMNNLLYGPGKTVNDVEDSSEALVYDKKAGQYSMDYILMALDLTKAGIEDDDLTNNLSDYTTTVSVRDDLVYTILNTAGCWGGSWFTYDTGCQNAQSLVPYYNRYAEVKNKLDEFESTAYQYFMNSEYTGSSFDASSAAEYIRFAAIMGVYVDPVYKDHAYYVYQKILDIGIENTKYKGNAMDLWRMALAEWGLGEAGIDKTYEPGNPESPNVSSIMKFTIDTASSVDDDITVTTIAHIQSIKSVTGVKLYEVELSVPDGVKISKVTSEISDNFEWAVTNGVFRATILSLDGSDLPIVSDKDIFTIHFSSNVENASFGLISSVVRLSSESMEDAGMDFGNGQTSIVIPVVPPTSIVATELYRGSTTSRFISDTDKAVKVVVGSSVLINGGLQVNIGENSYKFYKNDDFNVSNCSVFVGIVPSTVSLEDLSKASNYTVVKSDPRSVMFGDVNSSNKVDSADALSAVKIWVGKDVISSGKTVLATNVTKDDDITNADTLSIVEYVINGATFKVLQ